MKALSLVVLFCLAFAPVTASKKDEFKKVVKPSSKKLFIQDIDRSLPRDKKDEQIDELIRDRYGSEYRRANVYDLYPMEIPKSKSMFMDKKSEIELMEYYVYARKNLEKVSKSKFINAERANFDLDKDYEYAVILYTPEKDKFHLAIFNVNEELYFEDFDADFIELVNDGKYPTSIFDKAKPKHLKVPTLRIIDFGEYNKILYFDPKSKSWEIEEVQE